VAQDDTVEQEIEMLKLRQWLIRILAGNMMVAANLECFGLRIPPKRNAFIYRCLFVPGRKVTR